MCDLSQKRKRKTCTERYREAALREKEGRDGRKERKEEMGQEVKNEHERWRERV